MFERSRPAGVRKGRLVAAVAVAALVLAACGGDDDADSTTTTTTSSLPPVVEEPIGEPTAEPTDPVEPTVDPNPTPVRDGATVVVANSSRVNGAAGRMSERLAFVGYTMGEPTNSTAGQLETTVVYYDPNNASAEAVAETVRMDLGGEPVTVEAIPVPAPTEAPMGDATVLVMMGNDTADKTLDELQGNAPADTGGDTTGDETTGDATTTG